MKKLVNDMICKERPYCRCLFIQAKKRSSGKLGHVDLEFSLNLLIVTHKFIKKRFCCFKYY
jgi:hypothetical protein